MNQIVVRQAVLSDLEALAPLFDGYRQFYGKASDLAAARDFLRERFNHGESALFLALDGVAPIGFTQLYPSFSSASLARTFILNDLFVVQSHRRAGAGSKLLHAATEFARSLGAVRVTLSTDIQNTSAQATYEAQGWKRDKEYYVYHFLPQG
ncbi:GNAT family N-acetyltransferase [Variovorax sp. PAMC26660]|uniref:GNAT family N-acetyltransferase n=1 Tax=Variovorax sp. PAMC26660 TaxID=2762322 RepID=UPI00164EB517|nr:GNAT family N-acetyltransferase [Variovorax sp. PAMC26660]QNK69423.1 GNAT family N-acetyltransferase [Variovorax sp. PAMC26660]